ncbi:MAG: hypothetical protein IKH57_15915 [Clostridia bacterium]|nr:hypothetical protein [Clostridia bacterium]
MKKKSSISFGPGAASLLLIFVVLAMSVLGMLSLMNSRNDIRLSERSTAVMEAVYFLNSKSEESRARADAVLYDLGKQAESEDSYLAAAGEALAEQMKLKGSVLSWDETDGIRTIHCALEIQPLGSTQRTRWVRHTLAVRTAEEGFSSGFDDFDSFVVDVDWLDEESVEMEEEWIIDD